MRSRDGNRPYLFAIYALIITTTLSASSYYISYKSLIRNGSLISDELLISKAMRPCRGRGIYKPYYLILTDKKAFVSALKEEQDAFLEYLSHVALHVKSHSQQSYTTQNDEIELTFKPTCFKVDFNDGLAKITPIKESHL